MLSAVNVAIEHYRGFYERQTIEFAVPNGQSGSGLTVLVGPNNSGKSTVVNAIRSATTATAKHVDLEHRHEKHPLKITLTDSQGRSRSISNPSLGAVTVFSGDGNAFPTLQDLRIVPSRRSWSPYTGIQRVVGPKYWQNTHDQSGEDGQLVPRLAALNDKELSKYNSLLKELLPDLSSWKIELSRGQTFVQYETQSGAKHASDLFGDGMASLFRVALCIHDSAPGTVVVIDEPELSLHPQAQKALAMVLSRESATRQFIITTHSPYFVNWSDLSNGARVFRLALKSDGVRVSGLDKYTLENLKGLSEDWQKPNLLDAVAREVFFADEVLFLEGQEDVGLLRKFCIDKQIQPLAMFGYGVGGAGNIRHFLDMADDLDIRAAAIYDGDHVEEYKRAKHEFPHLFIELLDTPDIRDKHRRDSKGKETEEIEKLGIFDRSGVIKPDKERYLVDLLNRIRAFLKVN